MDIKIPISNNDLNGLALEVLGNYDILPESVSVVQSGSIKAVWKVKTKDRAFCLKRLKQSYDNALFSVNAQIYIKKSGGNVPAVIPNRIGEPITLHDNHLFAVYEWLTGKSLDFNVKEDLEPSICGLARFHAVSKGYVPPQESKVSSKLGKWPEQYNSMKKRMLQWKEECRNSTLTPCRSSYLKNVDSIVDISDLALYLLEKSAYKALASVNSKSVVLCHQDYGKGNALLTDQGPYVLDLDGVTFDIPQRDLRKIIGKRAETSGRWDLNEIEHILKLYTGINPLSGKELEVLFIDLTFPHWFFGLVKNMFQSGKVLKTPEIERIAKLEQLKLPLLNTLIKRGG